MEKKLVMISVNGKTIFTWLPVDGDGKVRFSSHMIDVVFGIGRGECVCIS